MSAFRNVIGWALKIAVAGIIVYLLLGAAISIRVGAMIRSSNASLGKDNPYGQTVISDADHSALCYRYPGRLEAEYADVEHSETRIRTPVVSFYNLSGGKAYYLYWYQIKKDGGRLTGSYGAPVTVSYRFEGTDLQITSVYERP